MRQVACVTMKSVACAVMAVGMIGQAEAADYLRGIFETAPPPPPPEWIGDDVDWAGIYGGAFVGGSNTQTKQIKNGLSLVNEALPYNAVGDQLAVLIRFKDKTVSKQSGGVFLGYNVLWDDIVLGVEADYSRANFGIKSTYQEGRLFNHPTNAARFYSGNAESQSNVKLMDWMTMRGRVGWAAGNFMPFITAGVAVGNLKSTYSTVLSLTEYENVTLSGCTISPCTVPAYVSGGRNREGKLKNNGAAYGAAFGAGVDFAFAKNFFVRAEWQYIQFASAKNQPDLSVNTLRLAGAMKF
jgi:outer membrane immunogenic protein